MRKTKRERIAREARWNPSLTAKDLQEDSADSILEVNVVHAVSCGSVNVSLVQGRIDSVNYHQILRVNISPFVLKKKKKKLKVINLIMAQHIRVDDKFQCGTSSCFFMLLLCSERSASGPPFFSR